MTAPDKRVTLDDIVGEKGVYDDVIASVKEDPDGPQIDIEKDLVAALGSRVTLITDHAVPIDTDSERLVIAVQAIAAIEAALPGKFASATASWSANGRASSGDVIPQPPFLLTRGVNKKPASGAVVAGSSVG